LKTHFTLKVRQHLRQTLRTIILLIFILIFGCKSNQKQIDDTTDLPEKTIESIEILSREKLTLDSIFKIDNDSILVVKLIELKNRQNFNEYGNNSDYISNGNILYPIDSLFKVINLFGDVSGGATNNPYAINYIIRDKKNISSKIRGEIFRIDKLKTDEYLFYSDNYWRLGSRIKVFESIFHNNLLKINEVNKKEYGNYLFDFIINKKEYPDSIHMRIDLKKWNNKESIEFLKLDANKIKSNEYYKISDEPFLGIEVDDGERIKPHFQIYYKHSYGDRLEKVLRINNKDKFTDLILAMEGGDSFTERIFTEFINDSIFKKTSMLIESNHETGKDLEFSVDSIITIFKYDKSFEFYEIKKDSILYFRKN
jgi:hypothetical protein